MYNGMGRKEEEGKAEKRSMKGGGKKGEEKQERWYLHWSTSHTVNYISSVNIYVNNTSHLVRTLYVHQHQTEPMLLKAVPSMSDTSTTS